MKASLLILLLSSLLVLSCSRNIVPQRPAMLTAGISDTIPLSEIDIPVHISLKPLYAMAENQVDTVYTSPGWPDTYIIDKCATRYMYRFRRGPLKIRSHGNTAELGFMGYYKIKGSQRACVGTTPVSVWTPPCTCGFNEPERRVEVGFNASFGIDPDYSLRCYIERLEPKPIDRCEMCFVKYDVTQTVMDALKVQLDSSRTFLQDSLGKIRLRSRFQQIWNQLEQSIPLYGMGYLQLNAEAIRVSQLFAKNDTLHVSFGVSARPQISFEAPPASNKPVPDLSDFNSKKGFRVVLDAHLNYDSLSNLVTAKTKGMRIDLDNGPIKKHMIVDRINLYGSNKQLILELTFSGSDKGVLYLTGRPVYNREKKMLEIQQLDYDIRTRDLLIKSAKWLFSKKILQEIRRHAQLDVAPYLNQFHEMAGTQMNRNFTRGIDLKGRLHDFYLDFIHPLEADLRVRVVSEGELEVTVSEINL